MPWQQQVSWKCWGMDVYSEVSNKPSGKYLSIEAATGQSVPMDMNKKLHYWGDETTSDVPTIEVQDFFHWLSFWMYH